MITFGGGNRLDASNLDDSINLQNWPVLGMYQPDAIAAFTANGQTYFLTANEGDARDYAGFSEENRDGDLLLDPSVFADAADLQQDANLERLLTTNTLGDLDGDGDFDHLYAYGARSFSVWDAVGNLVWDSSDDFETLTAAIIPDHFNATDTENDSFDNRSDDKGPEPEGIVVGVVDGVPYAFSGLERVGGVMVYDLSDPRAPRFVQYIRTRNFEVLECIDGNGDAACDASDASNLAAGGLAPEGLALIPAAESPNGKPLLMVGNEVSGNTEIIELELP
jgi:2',3'-cyclic-nucleotide 2'-phosphodiesterase/3'-nucleotidase/5'-nucleotidase